MRFIYYANYSTGKYDSTFDFTQITGIQFTVVNSHQDAANGYAQYGLVNLPFAIDEIKLGDCPVPIISAINKAINTANVTIFQNPASSSVKVSL